MDDESLRAEDTGSALQEYPMAFHIALWERPQAREEGGASKQEASGWLGAGRSAGGRPGSGRTAKRVRAEEKRKTHPFLPDIHLKREDQGQWYQL